MYSVLPPANGVNTTLARTAEICADDDVWKLFQLDILASGFFCILG
jgi:hypothetical protein